MLVLSSVDVKRALVRFVGDAIPDSASKHHLRTAHEIEHYIFKNWLKSLWINQEEVNVLVCGDLNSLIALDKVQKSSDVKSLVVNPCGLLGEIIDHNLEEQDLTTASCYQCSVVYQKHGSQIPVMDFLKGVRQFIVPELVHGVFNILHWDSEALALSVKGVNLV